MKDQIIRAYSLGQSAEQISMEFDLPLYAIRDIIERYEHNFKK